MRYLNLEEATKYLGLTKTTTLQALARGKKIAHSKIGRDLVFHPDWLDAYAQEHMVPAAKNPWGLTDAAVSSMRDGRATRTRRTA